MKKHFSISFGALLLFQAGAAHSGLITLYYDRSTFETAAGSDVIEEDFGTTNLYTIPDGVVNSTVVPGIESGASYSTDLSTSWGYFNLDSGAGFTGAFLDSLNISDEQILNISYDSMVSSFGFETNQLMGETFDITIDFWDDDAFTSTFSVAPASDMQFFGFQSDSADILSVSIDGHNGNLHHFAIDNHIFGGEFQAIPTSGGGLTQAVPEPGGFALFALGLLGMLGLHRRRFLPIK